MQTSQNGKLAFTVTWRARDGEADACANIIARFLPEARKEPGVELVTVNRSVSDPAKFLFYEVERLLSRLGSNSSRDDAIAPEVGGHERHVTSAAARGIAAGRR